MIDAWKRGQDDIQNPTQVRYVLYQLRHGGPSHDRIMDYRTSRDVQRRGRWGKYFNARRYEAAARVQQELAKFPPQARIDAARAPDLLRRWAEALRPTLTRTASGNKRHGSSGLAASSAVKKTRPTPLTPTRARKAPRR